MKKTEVYLRITGLLVSTIGAVYIRYNRTAGLTIAIFGFLFWVIGFIMRSRRLKEEQL